MTGRSVRGVSVAFDSRKLDDLRVRLGRSTIDARCRRSRGAGEGALHAAVRAHHLRARRHARRGDHRARRRDNWTDLDRISPFMQVAVLTTEDGAFYQHHGFNHAAIRNALVAEPEGADVSCAARAPSRCSSRRISFLRARRRSRESSRSSSSTDYLEQAFTKDEMMELYLNVIEFGPDVYGVTQRGRALLRTKAGGAESRGVPVPRVDLPRRFADLGTGSSPRRPKHVGVDGSQADSTSCWRARGEARRDRSHEAKLADGSEGTSCTFHDLPDWRSAFALPEPHALRSRTRTSNATVPSASTRTARQLPAGADDWAGSRTVACRRSSASG